MFDKITREQFRIDTVLPAIQTSATFLSAQILGRLGHYSVSPQTTVLLSLTASLVSSLADNFFAKAIYRYLAIPVGVGAGIVAQRLFYPNHQLNAAAHVKEILIISAIIIAVKLIADNMHRIGLAKNKVEETAAQVKQEVETIAEKAVATVEEGATAIKNTAVKALGKVEDGAKEVINAAEKAVARVEDSAKVVKNTAETTAAKVENGAKEAEKGTDKDGKTERGGILGAIKDKLKTKKDKVAEGT